MSAAGRVAKDTKRGSWYFQLDVPSSDDRRRQVMRRGFTTRKAAQAALDELKATATSGRLVRPSRLTFGTFLLNRWLPALAADTKLKPSTVAGYRNMAAHLVAGLGAVRLEDLSGDQLTALYGGLRARGLSERTVRYVHVTAHRALADACRWRLATYNAASDADAPAQPRATPKAWSPAQVATFLGVAAGDRWAPLWRLAATTGMRRGELVGLRWADVDLDAGVLVVARSSTVVDHHVVEGTPKNDRARRLALDAATVDVLKDWRRAQAGERLAFGPGWPGSDRVFTWPDGSALHPNVITRTFGRLARAAGLPPMTLHNLRHAWATSALGDGVDVKVVADRLGHASTRITYDIYTAAMPALDASAADRVAGLYDRQQRP